MLWGLKNGVRILDLKVLWELWVLQFQFLFLRLNHGFNTLSHLRLFFYGLIMTRKVWSWMLEWWLTIWLWRVVFLLTLWGVVIIIPILFIIWGLGIILTRIRPIWQTYLVKVMIYRVGTTPNWLNCPQGINLESDHKLIGQVGARTVRDIHA